MNEGLQIHAPVGIIGVGGMGLAIAERLIAGSLGVTGFRRGSLDAFAAIGGISAPSAAAVVATSETILLLLPSDEALHVVMAQIAESIRAEQILLCLGTHKIGAKTAARAVAAQAGAILIDGEVSGTPAMLRNGQASVMVAGDATAVERTRAVLDAFAKATNYLGPFGNATKMKLVTNYLVGVHTLAAAEALFLAERLDLDPTRVVETIAASAGGSTMLAVRGRLMAARAFDGHPMTGFMRFFDLLREALPADVADAAPLLDLTERLYRRAIEDGHGDKDIAAISASVNSRGVSAARQPDVA